MEENNNVEYIGAETYRGSGKTKELSFKAIVMNQLSRITGLQSKEWKGGYINKKVIILPNGLSTTSEIYIEDSRDAFINGLGSMHDLLKPYFDDKMKKEIEAFEKKLEDFEEEAKEKKYEKEKYKNIRVELYRDLLVALSGLFKRLRYLESKPRGDED